MGRAESGSGERFIHPNLVESLEFKSPNATPRDVFATTNTGYTKAIKSTRIDYQKKLDDELKHRLQMRRIVLDQSFEYGFDPRNNCPSNEQKMYEGVPLYREVTGYSTAVQEENKSKIERQNFTISHGIAGGREAEKEVWINQFTNSFHKASFS